MSWEIFKQNIINISDRPGNIPDIDTVARAYAIEYDAAIKRGFDTINNIPIEQGDIATMEQLFKIALQNGLSSTGPYDLVGEMGKGVIAYWSAPGGPASVGDDSGDEIDEEEAAAIQEDINIEYPKNQRAYERQFSSKEAAMENNSKVTPKEALESVSDFNNEPPQGNADTKLVGRGDTALFNKCGNGVWPALGTAPNFEVRNIEGVDSTCPRKWYKTNPDYLKKNCTQIMFPTAAGGSKILVHKNLAAIIKPALEEIKARGLQRYIENCGGGLAIRNVTCGTRLSNHSWGTAIDMNTTMYPYGIKFKPDGIYKKVNKQLVKVRDLSEFDKGFQQVAAIFKSKGMTWLSNNDPMHISIYE
jgi:hypothetical protein